MKSKIPGVIPIQKIFSPKRQKLASTSIKRKSKIPGDIPIKRYCLLVRYLFVSGNQNLVFLAA